MEFQNVKAGSGHKIDSLVSTPPMEHKQAMRLEELEKGQQDLKKKMHQIIEMMTSLMKERGVVESPNS